MLSKSTRDAVKWALERLGDKQELAKVANASNSYPEEFEWIWSAKPEREGGNPKKQAFQACKARIKEGATWRDLAEGVKRYRRYCDAKKLTGSEKVQQMSTFFGTKESFKESWEYAANQPATNAASNRKLSAAEENENRLRQLYGNNSMEGNEPSCGGVYSPSNDGHLQQPMEAHEATIELGADDWRVVDRGN